VSNLGVLLSKHAVCCSQDSIVTVNNGTRNPAK